jgi:hypothetical protein
MAKEKLPVYYASEPEKCDLCYRSFATMQIMYDAQTTLGAWANLCQTCFNRYGKGIGLGVGQRYQKQEDGRWLKTQG